MVATGSVPVAQAASPGGTRSGIGRSSFSFKFKFEFAFVSVCVSRALTRTVTCAGLGGTSILPMSLRLSMPVLLIGQVLVRVEMFKLGTSTIYYM